MKSFFVIKGEPNKWFDQQGNYIPYYGDTKLPYVKSIAEDPVNVSWEIDNPEQVPTINLSYRVQICKDEEEVKWRALMINGVLNK
jgi:hypothetical protein